MNITCVSADRRRIQTDLPALLTPDRRETARVEANQWIKRLRLVEYGSQTMRDRFVYRGASMWWFTELYLHKMRRLDQAMAVLIALDAARAQHDPQRLEVSGADAVSAATARAFGQAHRIDVSIDRPPSTRRGSRLAGYLVGATARLSRMRARPAAPRPAAVAAFVHTAFWRTDPHNESYIGPILDALTRACPAGDVAFVGVGPRRNFRARRWWDPLAPASMDDSPVVPIEQLAPAAALAGSMALWRRRQALAEEITTGAGVRSAAIVRGCDLWPVLCRELQDAALVQWPWSARAMDEAGSALDRLRPGTAVTYAEAGGWGRAMVIEARRRGVTSVGIQHGFIYRHWLNYLHEPDEMQPSSGDAGFPRPDRTLLFDGYAAEHLEQRGHFPPDSLTVTGSARLDDLIAHVAEARARRGEIRAAAGLPSSDAVALLTVKFTETLEWLPGIVDAVARTPGMVLLIKPHPAETADVYAPLVGGVANVRIANPSADLASLLAACDAIVTMNSTVAVDGLVLGIPALVVGLPSNLSPFVAAGVMRGADATDKIQPALAAVLYDRKVRQALADAAGPFVRRYGLAPDGQSASRAVQEILSMRTHR